MMGGDGMKVLHIISGNDNGGGGSHVMNVCLNGTMMEGIIGCIGGGFLYEKCRKSEIKTEVFSMKKALRDIPKYVSENNIDIVDFHGAKPFLIYKFLKRKLKVPCIATVHSDYRYDFLNSKFKYYFFTPLSRLGLKSFKHYICVSRYIKELLNGDGFDGEKYIVNNGIDLQGIHIIKNRDEIRKDLGFSEKDFVYVCVARLHPIKNHKLLLEAFGKLISEFKCVRLLIVGGGVLEEALKKQAETLGIIENVIFTGHRDNPIDYMNAGDVSILVSSNEGGAPPLVLLESAAVHKPVISSHAGDMEYILDDSTGFLVHGNSVEDIKDKMKAAYEKKNDLSNMGERYYQLVKNNYTMENFCNSYYEIYKKIL